MKKTIILFLLALSILISGCTALDRQLFLQGFQQGIADNNNPYTKQLSDLDTLYREGKISPADYTQQKAYITSLEQQYKTNQYQINQPQQANSGIIYAPNGKYRYN